MALNRYKDGRWTRDEAADFLEDYFARKLPNSSKMHKEAYLNLLEGEKDTWPDEETIRVADEWFIKEKING